MKRSSTMPKTVDKNWMALDNDGCGRRAEKQEMTAKKTYTSCTFRHLIVGPETAD